VIWCSKPEGRGSNVKSRSFAITLQRMPITLHWVGDDEADRVGDTRFLCYGSAEKDRESFRERLRNDPRSKAGDYLLAEIGGEPVGTATSLSLNMWVRGSQIPCQGVAWVGAIKTMRRRGGTGATGVASAVMRETIRKGRARGDVVSALMPFRGSFYEHFGYGFVERQINWTIPTSILPTGPFDGVRFYQPGDFTARAECLRRICRAGQCDIDRSNEFWQSLAKPGLDGMEIVDRPSADGPVHGAMFLMHQHAENNDTVRVIETFYEDIAALNRQLHFLASLRDQYSTVTMILPADLRLEWLLKETQLPHRSVNHAIAKATPVTRMQLRVLDHKRLLEALHLPDEVKGSATVAVQECEGCCSRFKVDISGGRAIVREAPAAHEEFACPDRVWATVACGDLPASHAVRLGLASSGDVAAALLDVLSRGPLPFSHEYF
jgi:predicted acetyltransferase